MAKSQSDRVSEYRFAEQLIAALEKGMAPWQKAVGSGPPAAELLDGSTGSVVHGGTDDASQRRPGPAAAAEALRLPVRPLGDYVPGGVDAMRRLIGGR